jgi:hypothetical protein
MLMSGLWRNTQSNRGQIIEQQFLLFLLVSPFILELLVPYICFGSDKYNLSARLNIRTSIVKPLGNRF